MLFALEEASHLVVRRVAMSTMCRAELNCSKHEQVRPTLCFVSMITRPSFLWAENRAPNE